MATYTAPTTRTTGALISASIWNTDIVENLKYFKDAPVFDGAVKVTGALTPNTNDGSALGSGTVSWADLFLASGGVINFNNGDVTVTHSSNTLTFAGAASGYIFNDGNVGIGVTPGSWNSSYKALQIGHSSFMSRASGDDAYLNANAVYGASNWTYVNSSFASRFEMSSGNHSFFTAPSGTAGNTITWTERFRVLNGGDVAIGATAKLYLDGTAGTGDSYLSEAGANVIRVTVGGVSAVQWDTTGMYLNTAPPTSASAANAVVSSGSDYLRRSTSSLRYKHDIATLDTHDALAAVMAMRPVTYRGKTDEDQRRHIGFIAEEMQEIAPLLCTYDEGGESGTPNYVTYDRVTAYLVAVVQQQQNEINALKARIH